MEQRTNEQVVLVDEQDTALGSMEKLAAHREGLLHRAFSVFVFNSKGELLLQQRARSKYHSPGRWSNTCCGHPRPDEELGHAARRRLAEEMGLRCELIHAFSFIYRADLGNGLIEHELDHVFIAACDHAPLPNASEVSSTRLIGRAALMEAMREAPADFSAWLPLCAKAAWEAFERRNAILPPGT